MIPAGNVIGGGKDLSITNIQSSQAGTYGFEVVVNGCKSDKATTTVAVKQSPVFRWPAQIVLFARVKIFT